jgi:hypothetical protein
MATPKLWKVSVESKRLNPSSISTHEPGGQGSSSRETIDGNPCYLVVEGESTNEAHGNVEDLEVLDVGSWAREGL